MNERFTYEYCTHYKALYKRPVYFNQENLTNPITSHSAEEFTEHKHSTQLQWNQTMMLHSVII